MEGRDLVKEAIADAKSLKEAAVESAKKELVESMAPAIRKLLDEQVRGALQERDRTGPSEWDKSPEGGTRQQKKDYGDLAVQEDLELEDAIKEFFPADGAVKENNMEGVNEKFSTKSSKKSKKSSMKEAASSAKSSVKTEEIEISEAELRKVYEAALQTEVQVKKGFSDSMKQGWGELDQASKDMGIAPTQGEKQFADGDVKAKKDWIPEARQLHGMLQRGLAENKALRESLRKAATMIETLGRKLHEVNLFNAKVLHVNKILNGGAKLTREQKTFVMESIDKARSISEVKMVYETIVGSIKTNSAAINESRNVRPPKANAQRARTTGAPDARVLSESVDKGQRQEAGFDRMRELAGLLK